MLIFKDRSMHYFFALEQISYFTILFALKSREKYVGIGGGGKSGSYLAAFLLTLFLYRVFLPFAIVGRTLRTRSISSSDQGRTMLPPTRKDLGADILPAFMYRIRLMKEIPSFFAAVRVE